MGMTAGSFHAPIFNVAWPHGRVRRHGPGKGCAAGAFARSSKPCQGRSAGGIQAAGASSARSGAMHVAATLEVDAVIDPAETRAWLVREPGQCATARVGQPGLSIPAVRAEEACVRNRGCACQRLRSDHRPVQRAGPCRSVTCCACCAEVAMMAGQSWPVCRRRTAVPWIMHRLEGIHGAEGVGDALFGQQARGCANMKKLLLLGSRTRRAFIVAQPRPHSRGSQAG